MASFASAPSSEMGSSGFGAASRFRQTLDHARRLSSVELAYLLGAGVLAAGAVAFLPLPFRVPGHAILKATLPIVLGVAVVPRPFAGTTAGLAAGASAALFLFVGFGHLQAAAVTALLAIGPAIDLALVGAKAGGWQLYARFAAAGMAANLLAFAVRWATAWLALDGGRPHMLPHFGLGAFLSFAMCGLLAGLASAIICFRRESPAGQ